MIFHFCQLLSHLIILFSQLHILLYLWVDIFNWDVTDVCRHASIGESLKGFFEMGHSGVETCDHEAV